MGGRTGKLSPRDIQELSKESQFTDEEIRDWFNEFKKRTKRRNSTALTVGEFKDVYNELFSGDASLFAENVFRTFDTDRNGSVDFREFLVGLSATANGDTNRKIKWSFEMYDIDGDGFISREEMKYIIAAWYRMTARQPASECDSPEKLVDRYFDQMDVNKDNQISWQEFSHGVMDDEFLVNLLQCNPDLS